MLAHPSAVANLFGDCSLDDGVSYGGPAGRLGTLTAETYGFRTPLVVALSANWRATALGDCV
jgi:hypothetical protein